MKLLITLMALSMTTSAFAEGAWRISCKGDKGISFYATNGESKISIPHKNSKGEITVTTEDAAVENYDLSLEEARIQILWKGAQEVTSNSLENICRRDVARTTFKQSVEIRRLGQKTLNINVTCKDEVLTSSGAEIDECLTF